MSYKTILVHVDASRHAPSRIALAAQLALAFDAHLVGAAMTGISRYLYQDSSVDLARTVLASHMETLYRQAGEALSAFEASAAAAGVRSIERRMMNDDPAGGLALQARYADLVVLSQTDLDEPGARPVPDLPGTVLLNSARPILVVPYAGQFAALGGPALVAWDASLEATRAVANALPLLRRARKVTVAVFNPAVGHGDSPGADLALYLARHGVTADIALQHSALDVGNALLSMAADLQAEVIVMGGYGRTRLRELLLGGVTATILKAMTAPVLMAH